MTDAHDVLFRTLADPTRRAIFERLCREGEQTVRALTARAKISQPAVSKHLWSPEAGGVGARPPRRPPDALQRADWRLGPDHRLDKPGCRILAKPVRRPRRSTQTDGPMSKTSTETRSGVVEREFPFPPEKIWRALTQPHLIEEWLMQNDFMPAVGHRFN